MPIRDYIPNIDALKEEVALLEEQRGILKSPDIIESLKEEIAGLFAKRIEVLAQIDEAKNKLDDTSAAQVKHAQDQIKKLQAKYTTEKAQLEGLIAEARSELAKITEEVKAQKDALPEIQTHLEKQKKAADKYIALIMAEAEKKGKELNERRNAYRQEMDAVKKSLEEEAAKLVRDQIDLKNKQEILIMSYQNLERGLGALRGREQIINDNQAAFEKYREEKKAELKAQTTKLEELQAMLANTSQALAERQKDSDKRISAIEARESLSKSKEENLASKWDEILKREADLETNWKVYAKAKKKLDLKVKEMGE